MYRQTPFAHFAKWTAHATGYPLAFGLAALAILTWLLSGPLFAFSDTWQLVFNTVTTIVTFLMVFLIQNTQNRDSVAMQLKLDEIIRALDGAHDELLDLEELEESELESKRAEYEAIARQARDDMRAGRNANRPPVPMADPAE